MSNYHTFKIKDNGHGKGEISMDGRPLKCRGYQIKGHVGNTTIIQLDLLASEIEIETEATPGVIDETQIQKLKLGPDDLIVVSVKGRITKDVAERLQADFERFAPGRKVAVMDDAMKLSVLSGSIAKDLPTDTVDQTL